MPKLRSHIVLIGWSADQPDAEPRCRVITGPAEPHFRAAVESGKYSRVALADVVREYQAWEAQG